MSRILLLEHNAPVMAPPSAWKVELVKPEPFGEDLIESYVGETEQRFGSLTQGLLENESLTEEEVKRTLAAFKDQFVHELREAHQAKRLRVSGPAQVENQRNGNGRLYPTELWDRVLGEDSDFTSRLHNRQVLGELEHPAEGNTKLPRVSHLVEKVWRKEGVVYAQHLIFRTPNGQIVEELYRAGAVPGVSSRGAGSTRSVDGVDVVEASDFHLDTWDFVAQPSVATARPSKIGESDHQRTAAPVSEKAIFTPTFVNPIEPQGGERNMPQLIESTEAIVAGRSALQASESYLNRSERPTLSGLLEHQQAVVTALGNLGQQFPDEYREQAANLRSGLKEHASTLRREIRKISEEDDEGKNGNGNGNGENGDVTVTVDTDGNGNGEGDDKEERLRSVLGLESLRGMSALDLLEALAEQNAELNRQTAGHVPAEKYRIAIELGEMCVSRANADKRTYESHISEMQKRLTEARRAEAASRTLLEATVSEYRGEKVNGVVEALIAKNPRLKRVEGQLRECKDVASLKRLIEGTIKPLIEGSSNRTDLPPTHTSLTEGRSGGTSPASRGTQPSGATGDLMEMLTGDSPHYG